MQGKNCVTYLLTTSKKRTTLRNRKIKLKDNNAKHDIAIFQRDLFSVVAFYKVKFFLPRLCYTCTFDNLAYYFYYHLEKSIHFFVSLINLI